eukprot:15078642-Alexandrium_andersonii.AAC.1
MRRSGWSVATTSGRMPRWRQSAQRSIEPRRTAGPRGRPSMGGSRSVRAPAPRPSPPMPRARPP